MNSIHSLAVWIIVSKSGTKSARNKLLPFDWIVLLGTSAVSSPRIPIPEEKYYIKLFEGAAANAR